jgi:hypothetical protein
MVVGCRRKVTIGELMAGYPVLALWLRLPDWPPAGCSVSLLFAVAFQLIVNGIHQALHASLGTISRAAIRRDGPQHLMYFEDLTGSWQLRYCFLNSRRSLFQSFHPFAQVIEQHTLVIDPLDDSPQYSKSGCSRA